MRLGSLSKYNKRILFLIDHKHRDLPSFSLIGYFLRQMGYEVKYVALWQEDPIIRSFKPRHLVLPKPLYELSRLVRFKINGHKLIVINTEGSPGGKTLKMNIQVPPDLYFFWNESELQIDSSILSGENTIFKLAGCPRTDFLREKFLNLFPSREELLKQYNLSLQQKTVTIATHTANAHLAGELLKQKIELLKYQTIEIDNFEDGVNNMRALKDITALMIRYIVSKYPGLNFVIKPHPNESIIYWQALVDSLSADNIHLSIGEPINHLLRVSDLNFAHNACTTTFESLLSGIPAVEIHTDQSRKLFKPDRLQLPTYTVKTVEELANVIEQEFYRGDRNKRRKFQRSEELQSYISKYYYKFDGLRCYEHARVIANFVKDSVTEAPYYGKYIVNNPKYVVQYLKAKAKRAISYTINMNKEKPSKKHKSFDADSVRISNDKMIDDKGLFDCRIKPGDEEYWYRKFEAAGFRLEDFENKWLDQKKPKAQYREDFKDV